MSTQKPDVEFKVIPLPDTGFLRIWQFLGCKKRGIVPHIPEGKTSWWVGVANGTRPPSIKLGEKMTVWRAEDIHRYIKEGGWFEQ